MCHRKWNLRLSFNTVKQMCVCLFIKFKLVLYALSSAQETVKYCPVLGGMNCCSARVPMLTLLEILPI